MLSFVDEGLGKPSTKRSESLMLLRCYWPLSQKHLVQIEDRRCGWFPIILELSERVLSLISAGQRDHLTHPGCLFGDQPRRAEEVVQGTAFTRGSADSRWGRAPRAAAVALSSAFASWC